MVISNTTIEDTIPNNQTFHFILGGARSGKSQYAEQCAQTYEEHSSNSVIYIATAQAYDNEMQARIEHHKRQRPQHWHTIEQPLKLAQALVNAQSEHPDSLILVDCLTLWVSNCLLHPDDIWPQERQALLDCIPHLKSPLIMVSNEVGWGIVPLGEISRKFVDESGRLHQQLAALAQQVSMVVAGIPVAVK